MRISSTLATMTACLLLASAPAQAAPDAKAVVDAFLAPGADVAALSRALQPKPADYAAVFEGAAAAKARAAYEPVWASGKLVIKPNAGQTQALLMPATTEELRSGKGGARDFPGGWSKVAGRLKPKRTWYRFKFVKPGATLGMAYDGLTYVNGHWAIFPKPWKGLD